MSLTKTTSQWYWKSDNGSWIPYPEDVNLDLENAFLSNARKCDVDTERYVEIGSKLRQRRKDGTGYPRDVKRDLRGSLYKEVIVLLKSEKDDLIKNINKCNGIVTNYVNKMVTVVVYFGDSANFQKEIKIAKSLNIPIVSESYLKDAFTTDSDYIDPIKYIVQNINLQPENDNKIMLKPSIWKGGAALPNGKYVSIDLLISYISSDRKFIGEMRRRGLNDARTAVKGYIDNSNSIFISEYKIIKANTTELLSIPSEYIGKFNEKGEWFNGFTKNGIFEFTLIKSLENTSMPFLRQNTSFEGQQLYSN